jgi:hypothetical protein
MECQRRSKSQTFQRLNRMTEMPTTKPRLSAASMIGFPWLQRALQRENAEKLKGGGTERIKRGVLFRVLFRPERKHFHVVRA